MANKGIEISSFHKKSGPNLMQNCDLPPPLKLYTGPDKMILKSMNEIYGLISHDEVHVQVDKKLEILKALRLSQTRARDAERRYAVLNKEKDGVSNLMIQESMRLLAYQQWVRLLELQVSMLQHEKQQVIRYEEDDCKGASNVVLFIAMSFCLGVGMGYVLHSQYLF